MKSFLVLISTNGELDPAYLATIPSLAARTLPFRHMSYRSQSWRSPQSGVALFAWENDPNTIDTPSVHVEDGRALVQTGYVVTAGARDPWNVGGLASSGPLSDANVSGLGGMFALAEATAHGDTVTIWKSASRAVPLYWSEAPGIIAVSTRALLLSCLIADGGQPVYDTEALVPFVMRGRFANDRTPFRNVHPVPPNSTVQASRDGIMIMPTDDCERHIGTVDPAAADLDVLADLVLASVRPLRGRTVVSNLTGGKDSRLVAAALVRAGADVRAQTSGFPESADVQVGQRVAAVLGIPHEVSPLPGVAIDVDGAVSIDPVARARAVLFGSDGMLSAYESLVPPARFAPSPVAVGGHGGEVALRDSFAAGPLTWDEAANLLRTYYVPEPSLLRPEALEHHVSFLHECLRKEEAEERGPIAALDRFSLHFDLGVSGVGPIVSEIGRYGWYPLMDNQVVKAGLMASPRVKIDETLLFNLMVRIEPRLVGIPFAYKRWTFEKSAPRRGDEEGWTRRAPIRPIGVRGAFNWRRLWSRELWEIFYERIFGDARASPLFEVLDRDLFEAWFQRRRGVVDVAGTALAWGAFSASVLLSSDWLDADPTGAARTPIRIAVPVG